LERGATEICPCQKGGERGYFRQKEKHKKATRGFRERQGGFNRFSRDLKEKRTEITLAKDIELLKEKETRSV